MKELRPTAAEPQLQRCPDCGNPLDGGRRCILCGREVADPRIGQLVMDRYLIDEMLGEGGMGTVYRATHVELGEPVAVKFLRAEWARTVEYRTRFRREAVILARLRHPGIVSVLDFGELEGELFMVMELVKGLALVDVIHVDGIPMSPLRIGPIFDEILGVLEVAHAANVVHRDLKPENVMLLDTSDRMDRIKVLDFGIAYMDESAGGVDRLTQTGTVRGTAHYMSPEQCKGIDVGPKTDIYAVGIMLFEALCGQLPFESPELTGLMVQHMFVPPPAMAERGVNPSLPRALEALVKRTLSKRAEERPSARELRDDLASVLRGTDATTFADKGAAERTRVAALSRTERALTGVCPGEVEGEQGNVAGDRGVVLWLPDDPRTVELRSRLAVNGVSSVIWSRAEPPEVDGDSLRLLVVRGDAQGEQRTRLARSGAFAKTPVLVVDAEGAGSTAAFIRAGASDVTLSSIGDEDLLKKLNRLLRRGR